jgi:hypothetical protein
MGRIWRSLLAGAVLFVVGAMNAGRHGLHEMMQVPPIPTPPPPGKRESLWHYNDDTNRLEFDQVAESTIRLRNV